MKKDDPRNRPFKDVFVDLALIQQKRGQQMRERMQPGKVEEYAELLRSNKRFNDLPEVYFDGSAYWPGDGFHRLAAYEKAGHERVKVRVREGGHREAMLHALGANSEHGMPRTRKDLRKAIRTALLDKELTRWSDRRIAELAKTTDKTVAAVRREMGLDDGPRVYEREGQEREMDVSGFKGRTLAGSVPANTFHQFPEPVREASRRLFDALRGVSKTELASFLCWLGSELLPLQSPKKFADFVTLLDAEAEAPPADADDAPTF
jgi:hypothetical protein